MTREDSRQVGQLFAECFAHPWSVESIEEMFDRPGYHNLVAQDGREIIGYIGMLSVLDEADITNVAVAEGFRRRHLGTRLLERLIGLAQEKGIHHIYLEVRSSNEAAIRLYEQAGFARTGIRKAYYSDPNEDAVLMRW